MFRLSRVPSSLYIALPAAILIVSMGGGAAQEQTTLQEPIAYIGHGAMFDQSGSELAPTESFLRSAQAWYRNALLERLDARQRAQFAAVEQRLTKNVKLDAQSRMVVDAFLIDWLIQTAGLDDAGRLQGKNNLMKAYLRSKLPGRPGELFRWDGEPSRISPGIEQMLEKASQEIRPGAGIQPETTNKGGQAYRDLCADEEVPIPPDFGTTGVGGWNSQGEIAQSKLFIVGGLRAEVLTYESTSPEGMCIALPRFDNSNLVQLDGVICMGKAKGNVCFWDNQKNGTSFTFTRGSAPPFSDFGGGTELRAGIGGVCSDCHAGENPYIIHDTPLADLAGIPLPTFPDKWHFPIVRSGDTVPWPENPGPMNSPPSCSTCHGLATAPGFAGRLPHLSPALPGYCGTILRTSIGALAPPLPGRVNAPATMPFGAAAGTLACTPGLLSSDPRFRPCSASTTVDCTPTFASTDPRKGDAAYKVLCTPEMASLLAWCGVPATNDAADRGDPHLTTANGVDYDFQGAGEFVALTDAGGVEIQVRQAPVASAGALPPNPYTGISSCVSVNTAVAARVGRARVSYQPNLSGRPDSSGMQLRVDGRPVTLGATGLGLAGGGRIQKAPAGDGIEVIFPDRTRLIASPAWWSSQSTWYLNLEVFDTQAREGIMGTILPGNWLPLLPDGSPTGPRPASVHDRYVHLYKTFANAWRVKNATSLFDYAPGTSTKTFSDAKWPPENPPCVVQGTQPAKPLDPRTARKLCSQIDNRNINANCLFDVTATGEAGFAKAYLLTQKLRAGATTVTVEADQSSTPFGAPVTFTATVAPATAEGRGVPTGTVQFTADGSKAGNPVKLDAKGRARWTTAALAVGTHPVAARYAPQRNSVFLASSSGDQPHTVRPGCVKKVVVSGLHFPDKTCAQSSREFRAGLLTNFHFTSKCPREAPVRSVLDISCQDAPIPGFPTGSVYQGTACCGGPTPP